MLTKPKPLTRSNHFTRAGSSGPAASLLGMATGITPTGRRSGRDDVENLDGLPAAIGNLDAKDDLGALGDRREAEDPQHVAVQKYIALAVLADDEAVAFGGVKPFHMTTDNHVAELSQPHRRVKRRRPTSYSYTAPQGMRTGTRRVP